MKFIFVLYRRNVNIFTLCYDENLIFGILFELFKFKKRFRRFPGINYTLHAWPYCSIADSQAAHHVTGNRKSKKQSKT